MVKLYDFGIYLVNGREIYTDVQELAAKTGHRADPALDA